MKKYIASYTSKTSGASWDLHLSADNLRAAYKDARKEQHGLMAGCKLYNVRLDRDNA